MRPRISLRDALADPQLLGNAIPGESWAIWRTLLIAAMGEELTDDERVLFARVTGRESEPLERLDEFWGIVGRRGGKTRAAGTLGAYVATLCDWSDVLAPGERGVLPVLAASTFQADRVFQHINGILQHSPMLSEMIEGTPTSEVIRLSTDIDIQIRPANFRTIRSITAVTAICDELAFWHIEGSRNPDAEVLNAIRPSMGTTGGMLFVISSPYAKRGELWKTFRAHHGPDGDPTILVAKGTSRTFNSTLPARVVEKAFERDPAAAAAEYGGEFRGDIEAVLSPEAVEACVSAGVRERGRIDGFTYFAFVDPSGGSADSMTMAIAHKEEKRAVLDVVREVKPPFSPEGVVAEFATDLARYGITSVKGDRYAGEWPREQFRKHGIQYHANARPKSELYLDLIPRVNSQEVDLLDHPRIVPQISGLERRTSRGGRDSIDHAPGGHDDVANAVAGALVLVFEAAFKAEHLGPTLQISTIGVDGRVTRMNEPPRRAWTRHDAPSPPVNVPLPAPAVPAPPSLSVKWMDRR
jgi:hypothetical protein